MSDPVRPRRKKKRKRAATVRDGRPRELHAGDAREPGAHGSRPATWLGAGVAVAAGVLVGTSEGVPSGYTLLALGVGAFLAGASHGKPRTTVLGAMAIAAVGLAWMALSSSPWAVSVAVGGGMSLAGGIHLLGRLGPEERGPRGPEAQGPEEPGPDADRDPKEPAQT